MTDRLVSLKESPPGLSWENDCDSTQPPSGSPSGSPLGSPSKKGGLAIKTNESIKNKGVFSKTRMCVYFLRGRCLHGDDCKYAHSPTEVRAHPDLRKTTLCEAHLRGGCKLSVSECKYAHGLRDLRATQEIFKTSLCRFWLNGKCNMGRGCRHAHGEHELRTEGGEVPERSTSPSLPSDPEVWEGMALISQLLATIQGEKINRQSYVMTPSATPSPTPSPSLSPALEQGIIFRPFL